ncbi:SDR family NAD(P)-dependent oxidoreductase [Cognatishimia sp. SS12]|uniref:SDR family NAD(P)-dependent oxidoreductase n=1 Tax=Cognatishimia sp. SS12 TaxID=2979465 RepID=UPI00232FADD6|nr:SDR family NAD(P)-dependent oxidoreductase [Cognatishimia sp. SS12]MDC0738072.1 SDR family NAD(P)-dependent oxidoreductase [Cognatishimia sp. SS12]
MKLSNKVAAITGGASGIGLSCAQAFLEEGARVVIFDVNEDNLNAALATLGENARGEVLNVGDAEAVTAAFDKITQVEGRLDILVASAAVPLVKPIIEIEPDEWQRVIDVNLTGLFYCSKAAAKIMVAQGDGRIVHMSSVNGIRAITGRGAYSVAKGGVEMLTKMMAAELGGAGITVNSVAPAPVDTPMIKQMHGPDTRAKWHGVLPIKRYATPSEVASATLFLVSDEARYITGHTLPVDGGFSAAGLLMES